MKRVMCVRLPDWPLQRLRCAQPEHKQRTTVLYADAGRRGLRVVTCCPAAVKRGIDVGMPLAEAKGLLEKASAPPLFLPADPEADRAALCGLAIWCRRFSPVVGIEDSESLLLDLSGCTHLFGGERRLSIQLCRAVERWGLSLRTAIADTVGTAWAVARFGTERHVSRQPNRSPFRAIIPPGEQQEALRSLPLQALRLPMAVVETLDELNVRSVEQLLALPRASLPSRFGPELVRRLDQALGTVSEFVEPIRPPEPVEETWEFEHPTRDRRVLETVLNQLLERIAERIAKSQQGVQQLAIHFHTAAKQPTDFTVGMLRPCQSAAHLWELVRTRLEQFALAEEITAARIEATTVPLPPSHQNRLFDNDNRSAEQRAFARLIDRLSNRLGKDRVVRPRLIPDPQPEYAVSWKPVLSGGEEASESLPDSSSRPLLLLSEPCPVDVTSVIPDGPPIRFFRNGKLQTVVRWWGPERIESGWWRDRHVRRDYYRIETKTGHRLWIFHQIHHGHWFLHGAFE